MTNVEELIRRVDMSATISDYVYDYENIYNWGIQEGKDAVQAKKYAVLRISNELSKDGLKLVDSNYDSDTGIAAIAVYDAQTEETYIAYAGTNWEADKWKDIASDMAIGMNDSLHLKKLGDTAVAFYDQVHRTGARITVTTGHSYGNFSSSRVAIERGVPYMFGYQGAPQYVSGKTVQEITVERMRNEGIIPPQKSLDRAQASRDEVNRLKRLMGEYSGYAVTFSTSEDLLTNALWSQSGEEIDYGGDLLHFGATLAIFGLSSMVGTYPDTHYVGKVIAVDTGTPHSMYHYRKNEDAMLYTRKIVLSQVLSVDINGDGIKEFALTPEYLAKQPLIPAFATGGDGKTIKLDTQAMAVLQSNLSSVKGQLEELASQTAQAIAENNDVKANLSARRQNLKDSIMNELEKVQLVQAIKDIDTAFLALDGLSPSLRTLAIYNTYEFKRKFDAWGSSGLYAWYTDGTGANRWDYGSVSGPLDDMVTSSLTLLARISDYHLSPLPNVSSTFYDRPSQTAVANAGAAAINEFETIVEETTKGLGNRSQFHDGIPEAVGEILEVIAANLTMLLSCTQYLIDVCQTIRETLTLTDDGLATSIQQFDMSAISVPNVAVASSYDRFLKSSQVFDDKQVLVAFDDAVDSHSDNLSSQMSTTFYNYLSSVQAEIESINSPLTDVIDALYSVDGQLSQSIYYRVQSRYPDDSDAQDIITARNPLYYYGTVGEQISVASTLSAIYADTENASSIRHTDRLLTTAITTINTVQSTLGGFKEPFRLAMEDAFYGAAGLAGIVTMQRVVGAVLVSMNARFTEFQASLSSHSGAAILALTDKVDETITTMGYVSDMIKDCFGD